MLSLPVQTCYRKGVNMLTAFGVANYVVDVVKRGQQECIADLIY